MEIKDIIALINAVSESKLIKFSYEEKDIKLSFKKTQDENLSPVTPVQKTEQAESPSAKPRALSDSLIETKGEVITSPMVGIFYSAPSEGAEQFASVGDKVKKGQIIGIVEAMKLMNEIESPYDGTVTEIFVKDKDMIGYGQELMRIV